MAKILIVTSGLSGIFNATSKLISLLNQQGYEVISASPNQDISTDNLEYLHYRLEPLIQKSVISLPSDKALKGISGLIKRNINRKERRKEAITVIEPQDFVPLIESLSPDLLMIDIEMHEYIIQSYGSGFPTILLSQFFSVWTDWDLPDIQSDTIIGRGIKGSKSGIRLAFFKLLLKRNYKALKMSLWSGGLSRKEILRLVAIKWNFPLDFIGHNLWPGPYVYEKIAVFNMTSEALDFPHNKRDNLHYIGPMVELERKDSPAKTSNEYTLNEVFQRADESLSNIVFCSVGTLSKGDGNFLRRVVDSFRDLSSWILILSIGNQLEESTFENRPENVFTFSHVPQLEVLSRTAVALVHGGVHTLNECIMHEVPMLVYSGKRSDQNGCAARLDYHGLAYRSDKDLDKVDDIRSKILAIAKDDNIKNNLRKLNQLITKEAEGNKINELITKVLQREI